MLDVFVMRAEEISGYKHYLETSTQRVQNSCVLCCAGAVSVLVLSRPRVVANP